jgi:uncharacterized protein YkwD
MKKKILPILIFLSFTCSKQNNDSSSILSLTQEDIDKALEIHNDARSDVGVGKLKWSATLSADAQVWATIMANKEKMYHSENKDRPGQGENLFYTTRTDSINPAKTASRLWYEEINLYTYSAIGSGVNNFSEIGHYTQMIWKGTTEVGIAFAFSKSGKTYVAARYSPPGNYSGEKPY